MYRKILVPLDGSKQAEEVLPVVRILAEVSKAEIVLLRVAEYPTTLYSGCYECPPADYDLAKIIRDKKEVINQKTQAYLERIASTLAETGIEVTVVVGEGPVVDAILASTDRLHVDLIALSPYGQGGDSHWTIGPVADRLLHEAPVPVILVRSAYRSAVLGRSFSHRVSQFV